MKPADTDSMYQVWVPILASCTHHRHYSSVHHRWSCRNFSLGSRQPQQPMGTGAKWESHLPSLQWGHTSVKGGIIQKGFFPESVIQEKWARAPNSGGNLHMPVSLPSPCCVSLSVAVGNGKSWGKVKGRHFPLCFLWCCLPLPLPFPPWTWLPAAIPGDSNSWHLGFSLMCSGNITSSLCPYSLMGVVASCSHFTTPCLAS